MGRLAGLADPSLVGDRRTNGPTLARHGQEAQLRRNQDEAEEIMHSRLPKIRKLKAMQQRIDRLLEHSPQINDDGLAAIARIRAMTGDDPAFANCETVVEYLRHTVREGVRKMRIEEWLESMEPFLWQFGRSGCR